MNRDSSVRRIVDDACAAIGRIASPAYEPAFMATAIGMVRAGLGATLLPSSALEITAASDLLVHPLDDPRLTRPLGILRKRQRAYSPAAEAFVAELEAFVARRFGATAEPRERRKSAETRSPHRLPRRGSAKGHRKP
jgi:DNA-binding transcriptional LysR family regulator